jgi:hypothetical protein
VWTMQLLADKLVELEVVDSISDETVRLALKKTTIRNRAKMKAIPGSAAPGQQAAPVVASSSEPSS